MEDPDHRIKIVSVEQAADEIYAVFLHEGRAWEERVRHYVTYRKSVKVEGAKLWMVLSEQVSTLSALGDESLLNATRPGFVGLRPATMPRKRFAEVVGLPELEAARYVAQCEEKDVWALGEVMLGEDD
jgi:hypothetical protein